MRYMTHKCPQGLHHWKSSGVLLAVDDQGSCSHLFKSWLDAGWTTMHTHLLCTFSGITYPCPLKCLLNPSPGQQTPMPSPTSLQKPRTSPYADKS